MNERLLSEINKNKLRHDMRLLRQNISENIRSHHGETVAALLAKQPFFKEAKHIALYHSIDGEMPAESISQLIWQSKKAAYLPVVTPIQSQLCFAPYRQNTPLIRNSFGILEPEANLGIIIDPALLDIVIVPVVAFDNQGHRLGRGGGYYDKTFSFLRKQFLHKPRLIGLAYAFQEQAQLPVDEWDIALSAVITEQGVQTFV
ncbi:MAG: 5-formyltetrahydrofolate cyclo-ligase [Gammaproteobacteria bacterium]|jgi:5-formyltetrahydrofolate cyclo-ligase|nr:5-formyltetrahydrofolate cyclo-ligase [Gammaproteobacteria bacterium]